MKRLLAAFAAALMLLSACSAPPPEPEPEPEGTGLTREDGMTVNLKGTFEAKPKEDGKDYEPVTFNTTTDSDKIIEAIRSFVDDYNEMATEIKNAYSTMPAQKSNGARYEPLTAEQEDSYSESELKAYNEKAKQGILFGDSNMSSMYSKLLSAITPGGENGQIEAGGKIDYVVSNGPEPRQQRYVASIDTTYDLSNLIGPGAGSASVTVMIRLHQVDADGSSVYRTLTEAKTITGATLLPVNYTSIESMNGSDQGEVEVVDAETGAVLKAYPLTFFRMD